MAASSSRSAKTIGPALIIVGVGYQWLYNGVNFLAFKVGGEAFHPLMLAALRFGIATILILPIAAWRWRVSRRRVVNSWAPCCWVRSC